MPITLEKLFSPTLPASFEWTGETVNMTWAPARYTGEMADLAEKMDEDYAESTAEVQAALDAVEEANAAGDDQLVRKRRREVDVILARTRQANRKAVRHCLSQLLVTWDVLDGITPIPTTEASLATLPPEFLDAAWLALTNENVPDPTKPGLSDEQSDPMASSAPSQPGTPSSGARTTSASRRVT